LKGHGLLTETDMSWPVFMRLESEVFPGLRKIQFGGNNYGEQLLAGMWDEVFDRVAQLGIRISVVSNGSLLTRNRITKMVKAGTELNFSLEGATLESYERVRQLKYDKFMSRLEECCRGKLDMPECGGRVNLGFTLLRDNIEEIPELMRVAGRLGVDRVVMNHFIPWEESQRNQSLVYHKELANRMIEKAAEMGRDYGIIVDHPAPFGVNGREVLATESANPTPCYHPWTSVSVNEKGEVMPCCASSVVMGNLEKSSFEKIWNGWKYRKLRRTVNSPRPLSFCRDCSFRGVDPTREDPITMCSDEKVLLAVIGKNRENGSSPKGLRKVRDVLTRNKWAGRFLPRLTDVYRRHVAFFS
jgi:radical SAM protein with 4Fe4S-binding SPASM domain